MWVCSESRSWLLQAIGVVRMHLGRLLILQRVLVDWLILLELLGSQEAEGGIKVLLLGLVDMLRI